MAITSCIINVMQYDAIVNSEDQKTLANRITISISPDNYAEIQRIAKAKRVSASWVVRDAVDKYLAAEMPLFRQTR